MVFACGEAPNLRHPHTFSSFRCFAKSLAFLPAGIYFGRMKKLALLFNLLLLSYLAAEARFPPDSLSRDAYISLVTVSPGPQLYSTFGHSAIRVVDKAQEFDFIYNYGTFDFDEPGFYLKFCRGQLDYQLSAYPFRYAFGLYRREGRIVTEQRFNLTRTERDSIYRFLNWNHLPANRNYRYDFFFDNCATRILDVFENTLGDSLQVDYSHQRNLTFRDYIDLYLTPLPFSDLGIDIVLGARTDATATTRQAMFLPDYLFEGFSGSVITRDGVGQPFVSQTDTLLASPEGYRLYQAFPLPAVLTWGIFLTALLLTFGVAKSWPIKWFDRLYFALCGIFGLIIALLWWGTEHKVTPDNLNLLWLWPTHLLVVFMLYRVHPPRWLNGYFVLHALTVAVLLLGWFWWPQRLHPAMIPMMLTLIFRSLWMGRQGGKS